MQKIALTLVLGYSSWTAAQAQSTTFTLPTIPGEIAVPTGHKIAQTLLGRGTQNYFCQAKADKTGFEWAFKAPQADILDNTSTKVASHYAGPTWEAFDSSSVMGEVKARAASKDSIPWLLLSAKSNKGSGVFGNTRFIQRLSTTGGLAPTTGCDASTISSEAKMAYTSLYVFYASQ